MRYDFRTITMSVKLSLNGCEAVEAVCRAVEVDSDWDSAENLEQLDFYILRAAQNVNRFEPFSKDEIVLNRYLADRMAGKRLCDYAWRMLAQSKSEFQSAQK